MLKHDREVVQGRTEPWGAQQALVAESVRCETSGSAGRADAGGLGALRLGAQ